MSPPFSCPQTEYGKPPGYDRARQKVIGKTDVTLSLLEEAFTSEHWIVRIYKVHTQHRQPSYSIL